MKKIFLVTIFIMFEGIIAFSQNLDGFKYVQIEQLHYLNSNDDKFGIVSQLKTLFFDKGFIVLDDSSFAKNRCAMLKCYVTHSESESVANYVTITLKDCNNQIVHTSTGNASTFTIQGDLKKATKLAFLPINSITYHYDPDKTPKSAFELNLESELISEKELKEYLINNTNLDQVEGIFKSFQSSDDYFYKIGIKRNDSNFEIFILETTSNIRKVGDIIGIMEKSTIEGVYSLKYIHTDKKGYESFCTLENGSLLSIQVATNLREKIKFEFIKMDVQGSNTLSNNATVTGSGVVISVDGIVATNAHVIEGKKQIQVTFSSDKGSITYNTKLILVDKNNDIALLQILDSSYVSLDSIPFGIVDKAEIGEEVFTIGFPLNSIMGENYKVTNGIISAKSGYEDDMRYYQTTVPIQPGNSGGPLFSKTGNLIGLTSAKLIGGKEIQIENVSYSIKSSYLITLYNMQPNPIELKIRSGISKMSLQEQIKILRNYVCLIKAN